MPPRRQTKIDEPEIERSTPQTPARAKAKPAAPVKTARETARAFLARGIGDHDGEEDAMSCVEDTRPVFADNPHYRQYEALLKQLHELDLAGKSESEEADALRDRMDAPWYALSVPEQDQLGAISVRLYQEAEAVEKGSES